MRRKQSLRRNPITPQRNNRQTLQNCLAHPRVQCCHAQQKIPRKSTHPQSQMECLFGNQNLLRLGKREYCQSTWLCVHIGVLRVIRSILCCRQPPPSPTPKTHHLLYRPKPPLLLLRVLVHVHFFAAIVIDYSLREDISRHRLQHHPNLPLPLVCVRSVNARRSYAPTVSDSRWNFRTGITFRVMNGPYKMRG